MTEPLRLHTIIVAMDFSPHALRALELARELASATGPAHVILAHGYHFPVEIEALSGVRDSLMSELAGEASKQLEQLLTELQDAGISSEYYAVQGRPDVVITDLARDKHADLIVMGTHGHTGLRHLALGSVAERVVRDAPCPVLTVKVETGA